MTIPVPIVARDVLRKELDGLPSTIEGRDLFEVSAVRELVEFAEQFGIFALPGMTQAAPAGEFREIVLTDASLRAEDFDLIRLNGRVFSPEVVEVEGEELEVDFAPLPADVVALVIAGREALPAINEFASIEEYDALDKALEAFSSRVPYDDQPEEEVEPAATAATIREAVESGLVPGLTASDLPPPYLGAHGDEEPEKPATPCKNISVSGGVVWGDGIEVDGRPEWMKGNLNDAAPRMLMRRKLSGLWSEWSRIGFNWNDFDLIRLPADHPYYLATAHGLTYWPGGDDAPADWDSKRPVLGRDGTSYESGAGVSWSHCFGGGDIIGYHRRAECIACAEYAVTGEHAPACPHGKQQEAVKPTRETILAKLRTDARRDEFAKAIAQGILAGGWADTVPLDDPTHGHQLAAFAFDSAEAMLVESDKRRAAK